MIRCVGHLMQTTNCSLAFWHGTYFPEIIKPIKLDKTNLSTSGIFRVIAHALISGFQLALFRADCIEQSHSCWSKLFNIKSKKYLLNMLHSLIQININHIYQFENTQTSLFWHNAIYNFNILRIVMKRKQNCNKSVKTIPYHFLRLRRR